MPRKKHAPSKRRILVVEDNADAAATLVALLRAMGHECWSARDGIEALERFAEHAPELVLLG